MNNFYVKFKHVEQGNTLVFRDQEEYLEWKNNPMTNRCDWWIVRLSSGKKDI